MSLALPQSKLVPRPLTDLRPASMADARALAALEATAWPERLQAKEELIRQRFALGHMVMVVDAGEYLAGAVCFVPTSETPFDPARFPASFRQFSSVPCSVPVNSIYAYNFCVHPAHRGEPFLRQAIRTAIVTFRQTGARWLVGAGRCPSYAGSDGIERVPPDVEFRAAIDGWAKNGQMPELAVLIRDPVLRFYHRMFNCRFLHLAPEFMPEDVSSGGYAVSFVRRL